LWVCVPNNRIIHHDEGPIHPFSCSDPQKSRSYACAKWCLHPTHFGSCSVGSKTNCVAPRPSWQSAAGRSPAVPAEPVRRSNRVALPGAMERYRPSMRGSCASCKHTIPPAGRSAARIDSPTRRTTSEHASCSSGGPSFTRRPRGRSRRCGLRPWSPANFARLSSRVRIPPYGCQPWLLPAERKAHEHGHEARGPGHRRDSASVFI
jgi:hypothetical protein